MNLNRIIQSLLIALAVVGVFAAMARNAYGFDFIGVACFGLSLLFLVQLVWKVVGEFGALSSSDIPEVLELLLLSLLTLMFGLRAFYIYVNYSEIIFNAIIALQLIIYSFIGYSVYSSVKKENMLLAKSLMFFYISISLFLVFLLFRSNAVWSMRLGVLAVLAALPFFMAILRRRKVEIKSKTITLFHFVVESKNKAGLLFLFFISSALFTGLTNLNVIPSIENGDRPKDYIELINNANTGNEKPVTGQYQHEKYKEVMNNFLNRHGKK